MKQLKTATLAGILACAFGAGQAHALTEQDYQKAQAMTGGTLGELCSAKPDGGLGTASVNLCHGYARGAVSAYLALESGLRHPLNLFCLPPVETIAASTVLNEYATWVQSKPEQSKAWALDALFAFLGTKFPCGK